MPSSTLDPDFTPEPDRQVGIGHGTDSLGPSDLSDTGSDVQGGYRAIEDLDFSTDCIDSLAVDDIDAATDVDTENDPDAAVYVDPALEANAAADARALDDPDAPGNPLASADPDTEIDALADGDDVDDDAEGEVPLFDKVTRTEERPPASRRH